MLILQGYKEIDELEIGQTIRVNHMDCTAGEDTRRRLYLTRPQGQPDRIVGYCHNCQEGGALFTDKYESYRKQMHSPTDDIVVTTDKHEVIEPPPLMITDVNNWPGDAQAWLIHNKLNQQDVDNYKIAFDPSTHRVYLPKYSQYYPTSGARTLDGYQLRKVRSKSIDKGPKYLTVRKQNDNGFTKLMSSGNKEEPTVLVEDLVSGIHVHMATDCNVIVNYGVKVNIEALYSARHSNKFIVWLDNDSGFIRGQAMQMAKTWDILKKNSGMSDTITKYSDPKHYTHPQIKKIVEAALTWTQ